jgi:hypothetical protein
VQDGQSIDRALFDRTFGRSDIQVTAAKTARDQFAINLGGLARDVN